MTERASEILKTVVQIYIDTGEPVGSRTVAKNMGMKLSPATIRNVMADLEEAGYLHQPHTSAGRVPTDMGYRYYIDHLLTEKPVEGVLEEFERHMDETLRRAKDVRDILRAASRFLSERSRQVGLLFIPKLRVMSVRNVEFIRVAERLILVIFASEAGIVQHRLINLSEDISQKELEKLAAYVNQHFSGKSLAEIRKLLLSEMEEDMRRYDSLFKKAIELSKKAVLPLSGEEFEVHFEGTSHIFEHKEFIENIERLREIFRAFEEKSKIVRILDRCMGQGEAVVIIGEESGIEDFKELSMIITNCSFKDRIFGALGVVSSKRVDYAFLIPLVERTARYIEEILN